MTWIELWIFSRCLSTEVAAQSPNQEDSKWEPSFENWWRWRWGRLGVFSYCLLQKLQGYERWTAYRVAIIGQPGIDLVSMACYTCVKIPRPGTLLTPVWMYTCAHRGSRFVSGYIYDHIPMYSESLSGWTYMHMLYAIQGCSLQALSR